MLTKYHGKHLVTEYSWVDVFLSHSTELVIKVFQTMQMYKKNPMNCTTAVECPCLFICVSSLAHTLSGLKVCYGTSLAEPINTKDRD